MQTLFESLPIAKMNLSFKSMTFEQRIHQLYDYFEEEDVLVTSSFGANSAFLLHLISQVRPHQKIYFIDTSYHFEETIAYKQYLTEYWKLNIVDVLPDKEENEKTKIETLWIENPDECCRINKVGPLSPIKSTHKVWISGLMAFQTPYRASLDLFSENDDIIKFHPLIDMSEMLYLAYMAHYHLPAHPLQVLGYGSIGCIHCTKKGEGRDGRWLGTDKTECGLHL